jgi:hypothetical protein
VRLSKNLDSLFYFFACPRFFKENLRVDGLKISVTLSS